MIEVITQGDVAGCCRLQTEGYYRNPDTRARQKGKRARAAGNGKNKQTNKQKNPIEGIMKSKEVKSKRKPTVTRDSVG